MVPTRSLGQLLAALDAAPPFALADVLRAELALAVGVSSCTILLADYESQTLEPVLGEGGSPRAGSQSVEGSMAGRCYREQQVQVDQGRRRLCVAITVREERVGVLDVRLAEEVRDGTQDHLVQVASLLAHVINGARRYTDHFERIRRRRDLSLAAEIQWELLPVLAFAHASFSIAGNLEPAYDIGGDTFDYAVEADRLILGISDGRGHGLHAALLGALAITALRNSRRRGEGVVEQATAANRALAAQFGGEDFVTAALLLVDVPSGATALINAGHLPPLILRVGRCQRVPLEAQPPLGMFARTTYRPQRFDLLPGDRLVLFTDGITEATSDAGTTYGEARLVDLLLATRSIPPAETVRLVTSDALSHRAGQLNDDATVVVLDWHGPTERDRALTALRPRSGNLAPGPRPAGPPR